MFNEHVQAFAPATVNKVGITIVPLSYKYKYREGTLIPWHRIALRKVAWVYQVEKNPAATFILLAVACGWINILYLITHIQYSIPLK